MPTEEAMSTEETPQTEELSTSFQNNILLVDTDLTADMRNRQDEYISSSAQVSRQMVEAWPIPRRLWNNAIAMLGPVL